MSEATIGTGLDFATLTLWEASLPATMTEDMTALCANENVDSSGRILFRGTTTNGFTLTIRAADGAKHDGTAGSGARVDGSFGGGWGFFDMFEAGYDDVLIQDMEIDGNGHSGVVGLRWSGGNNFTIRNCIFHDLGNVSGNWTSVAILGIVENCAVWDWLGTGACILGNSGDTDLIQCRYVVVIRQVNDVDNGTAGFRHLKATNCASFHHGPTSGWADFLNLDVTSSNNASSDGTGSLGLRSLIAADQFVSVGGTWNLKLKEGSDLEGAGVPVVGVSTDFEGDARDPLAPDVGFDEFGAAVVVAGLPPKIIRPHVPGTLKMRW